MALSAPESSTDFNVMSNPYMQDNFTSISGSDVTGAFGNVEMTNLLGVNVSVNREVNPVYVMGETDPSSFVRGKRGVAGSLVTVCNDRGALYDIIERYGVYAQKGRHSSYETGDQRRERVNSNVLSETDRLGYTLRTPDYEDQLPPFDVTLVGHSDSLTSTVSRIGGVFIVSKGTGISVDDNSIEQQMTFVALFYEDWQPAGRLNQEWAEPTNLGEEYDPLAPENQGQDVGFSTSNTSDTIGDTFFEENDI